MRITVQHLLGRLVEYAQHGTRAVGSTGANVPFDAREKKFIIITLLLLALFFDVLIPKYNKHCLVIHVLALILVITMASSRSHVIKIVSIFVHIYS